MPCTGVHGRIPYSSVHNGTTAGPVPGSTAVLGFSKTGFLNRVAVHITRARRANVANSLGAGLSEPGAQGYMMYL